MSNGRDVGRIKIKSGGSLLIGSSAFGSGAAFYRKVGSIENGKFMDKTTGKEITEWTGYAFRKKDKQMVDFQLVLNQTSQHEQRLGSLLKDELVQILFTSGKVGPNTNQMIFIKQAELMFEMDLDIANKQIIRLDFSIIPQEVNVNVAYGGLTRVGDNPFYCLFDFSGAPVIPVDEL
jgi:hypothetical protein